jgi:hypothetical protein
MPRLPTLLRAGAALALLLAGPARAQTGGPTLATVFERDVNRYAYVASLTLADAHAGPWQTDVLLRAVTEAFGVQEDLLFRDEGLAVLSATRAARPGVRWGVASRSAGFSQGRAARSLTGATLELALPGRSWRASGLVGAALDQRPGVAPAVGADAPLRTDAGPAVEARAQATGAAAGYAISGRGLMGWQQLTPRRQGDAALDLRLSPTDAAAVPLAFDVALRRSLRGTYQSASFLNRTDEVAPGADRVEETTLDTLLAGATLATAAQVGRWGARLDGRIEGEALGRSVRTLRADAGALFYDSDYARRALRLDLRASAERGALSGHAGVRTDAVRERRTLANRAALPPAQALQKAALLEQADFDQSTIGADVRIARTGRLTTLFAEAQASLLRLDTPDANDDDRDEAFASVRLGSEWRVSPRLGVEATLFASDYHTVYLRAARSGENSRQRAIRLQPATTWTPTADTRVRLQGEVRATYTRDDFRLPGRQPNDQSAREQRLGLDAEHRFDSALRLYVTATASDLRLGRLLPGRFAEVPFDTVRTYDAHLRLVLDRGWQAELGARLFYRTDYSPAVTTRFPRPDGATAAITRPGLTWLRQLGPTCRLSVPIGARGSSVELAGWYAVQRQGADLYGRLDSDNEAVIRRSAERRPARLLPRVSLGATWRL